MGCDGGRSRKGTRALHWTGNLMEGQALGPMPTISSTETEEKDISSSCNSQEESEEESHAPKRISRTRQHLADLHQGSRAVVTLWVCPGWTRTAGSFCFPLPQQSRAPGRLPAPQQALLLLFRATWWSAEHKKILEQLY